MRLWRRYLRRDERSLEELLRSLLREVTDDVTVSRKLSELRLHRPVRAQPAIDPIVERLRQAGWTFPNARGPSGRVSVKQNAPLSRHDVAERADVIAPRLKRVRTDYNDVDVPRLAT